MMKNRVANELIDFLVSVIPDINETLFYKFIKQFVEDKDINKTQLRCLLFINNYGAENMSILCSKLNVEKGSITSMIDDLTKKGYVNRVRDAEDKRKFSINISDSGQQIADVFVKEYKNYLKVKLENVTDDQFRELEESIRRIKKILHA